MFDDFGINMNFANPQEHVPEAKSNNRVIKERVRATFHLLPYKQITKIMTMTKILVMEAAKQLNFFQPCKEFPNTIVQEWFFIRNISTIHNTASTPLEPTSKLTMNQTKKNLSAQTLDCIYLQYKDSHQGGHKLLHLPTNKIITRRAITPLPITKSILDQVSDIATNESMPIGLKIQSKTVSLLYHLA
jgi:hypothetical protein